MPKLKGIQRRMQDFDFEFLDDDDKGEEITDEEDLEETTSLQN